MKILSARVAVATVVPMLMAGALSSCISQEQYDQAAQDAKYYQSQAFDWEQYAKRLEKENEKLKDQAGRPGLAEASFDEIESRMDSLRELLNRLGRPIKDVEIFKVDGGYVVMVQDKILFASGSADISAEGQKAILQIAGDIRSKPYQRIWVRGHTDSDPVARPATKERFPHGNIQLSSMRAIEVASILTGAGKIPSETVAVVGFGPYEPLVPNDSADNKRLNRRVEIFVAEKAASGL